MCILKEHRRRGHSILNFKALIQIHFNLNEEKYFKNKMIRKKNVGSRKIKKYSKQDKRRGKKGSTGRFQGYPWLLLLLLLLLLFV
jgi:hypothetical protein